mgnify:CR=1 FL=1|jgi:DNA-binding transcriptional MerR regulator
MPRNQPKRPLTVAEVAGMFDKNPSTILRWTRDGKLTPIAKLPGKTGAYLYDAKKIQRLASKATA